MIKPCQSWHRSQQSLSSWGVPLGLPEIHTLNPVGGRKRGYLGDRPHSPREPSTLGKALVLRSFCG
ncbi:hypothetical protein [Prochlorothrix hollandica]|uniref:hypothetical protein n=1 Tax=Prochlorothrix hollandica TaxID=1223 RepID=UPI000349EAC1|nr:hypothetical protein [Prochlorothrix hollandica]